MPFLRKRTALKSNRWGRSAVIALVLGLLAASVLVSTLLAIAQNADAFRQLNPHLWQQLNNGFR